MPNNSISPHMSLVTFKLLFPCKGSEVVSVSKFMYRVFKKNFLGLQKFPSSSASIPVIFFSQMLWGLLFLPLELWAGEPGMGPKPLVHHGGPPQLRYPSRFLFTTPEWGTNLSHVSATPTSLNVVSILIL